VNTESAIWTPHITVAAIGERDHRFLIVEEETDDGLRFNQPAGHLDPAESLTAAAIREAFEETAYRFRPSALVGIYQYHHASNDTTYIRFAFAGEIIGHDPQRALDRGIVRAAWLTHDELRACTTRHRTPLVIRCNEDYLAGHRYPLDVLHHFPA
jgi:8-oxo-dGTP pyrophosphatase MutT (NUDIX family)